MAWKIDGRVPVRFGALSEAGEGDAVLIEGDAAAPAGAASARFALGPSEHAPDCACCAPRGPASLALNQLFQARARGEVPFFRRVLAVTESADAEMAIWAALRADPLVSGRFRME